MEPLILQLCTVRAHCLYQELFDKDIDMFYRSIETLITLFPEVLKGNWKFLNLIVYLIDPIEV
jgi:hypothetical protein